MGTQMELRAEPFDAPTVRPLLRESLPAAAVAAAAMLLSLTPYLYGLFKAPPGHEFTFVHSLNSADLPTYLAQIERARRGEFFIRNPYTVELPNRGQLRPIFLCLGLLARITGISNAAAYHAGRVASGVVLAVALYLLASCMFETVARRRLAVLLAMTSSGLGWLYVLVSTAPHPVSTDIYQPESILFMSAYESPHMTMAQALMALLVFSMIRGVHRLPRSSGDDDQKPDSSPRVGSALAAGACGALMILIHPFNVFPSVLACGAVLLLGLTRLRRSPRGLLALGLIVAVMCALPAAYILINVHFDVTLQIWKQQNRLPSGPWYGYLLGFGLLWPLAALGCVRRPGRGRWVQLLFVFWIAAHWLSVYLPFSYQRRMAEGWHIPISMLAASGLVLLSRDLARRWPAWSSSAPLRAVAASGIILLLSLSNVHMVRNDFRLYAARPAVAYIPTDLVQAMRCVRSNSHIDDVVLTDLAPSSYLPAVSGNRVFGGHHIQGIMFDQTHHKYSLLMSNRYPGGENEEAAFMEEYGVRFWLVQKQPWLGPRLLQALEPWRKPYLEKAFENEQASVWRVKPFGAGRSQP